MIIDNESKLGDHGVRKYEYETGRFISIDPLWGKYYGWTPYQYSMNSPVMLVDFGGEDVVVALSGGNWYGNNDLSSVGYIVNQINKKNIEGMDAKAFATSVHPTDFKTDEAIKYIKSNLSDGENLYLYGYSAGGVGVMQLAKQLDKEGISVSKLVTVDAALGVFSNGINREIPSNVKENINYYTEGSFSWFPANLVNSFWSHGGKNKKKNESTNIKNIPYPNDTHSTIDDATNEKVIDEFTK